MSDQRDRTIERHLEPVVIERMAREPVVVVTGARTAGKSTLLQACARAHAITILDLDDPETRSAVADNPTLFVGGRETPVLIDEFQHSPEVLSTIKAELNRDLRPGRFLLSGSTSYHALPQASQSLTGRSHVLTLWPFSQGELRGVREEFLDILLDEPARLPRAGPSTTARDEYEKLIVAGGFPLAVRRPDPADRRRWFADFIARVIERDVLDIRRVRQREVLPALLRTLAARTGNVLNASSMGSSLGLDARTVGDFITLLESVFLVHRLPAYGRTLAGKVARSPKLHLVDSGLASYLLQINERRLAKRRPETLAEFGHVVETFVVNELMKQAGWSRSQVQFSHFRTREQHEVDLVAETDEGIIAGVEVKAAERVSDADFRGLRLLRDKLGSDFAAGAIINLGRYCYQYDDRLFVVPLDRIWSPI